MKLDWRTRPMLVNSVSSISARSSGRTHVASRQVLARRARVERALGGGQGAQPPAQVVERRLVEPGAHAAGELQAAVVARPADEQRPERPGAVAAAGAEPADHHLGADPVLDLAPLLGALARRVGGAEALGHHPFQAALGGGGHQRRAVTDAVRRHEPVGARFDEAGEQLAALLVRQADRVGAVDREHVEHVEHGLGVVALQRLEARPAGVVEAHDLAVEHGPPGVHRILQTVELGVLGGDVEQPAALQAQRAAVDEGQRAVAVPLDLVGPVVVVRLARQRAERRRSSARRGSAAPPSS